ncbi:MAG TPA: hypothetical protein VJX47_08135 [Candidatus Sulfotelmatobacter sp.]|nr:hypothetical protein [Candidatus Sulfotelmatobacter sp.]
MTRKLAVLCTLILALVVFAGMAQAQTAATSPYRVDYFSNANTGGAPDGTLRLDNDGAAGGNLCADIYVFDSNEELSECCSCLETPDGLRTLSINSDLTANPLTGVVLSTGVIKVVAAAPTAGACPVPNHIALETNGEIQGWATHIQNSNFAETETASQVSFLSATEQTRLARQCGAILSVGSGKGICTCGTGTGE